MRLASKWSKTLAFPINHYKKISGWMESTPKLGAYDLTTVGGRIKKLRTDAGFTQEELAIELHLEGKSAISNYENNSRGVSAEMLTQLSRLFHVSADYILNGDSPDNLDPIVNEAIEILNNLKTDKAKRSALELLRQIQILEG